MAIEATAVEAVGNAAAVEAREELDPSKLRTGCGVDGYAIDSAVVPVRGVGVEREGGVFRTGERVQVGVGAADTGEV